MKKLLSFAILILLPICAFSQHAFNTEVKSSKGLSSFKSNAPFVIDSVEFNPRYETSVYQSVLVKKIVSTYIVTANQKGKKETVAALDFPKDVTFTPVNDNLQDYWLAINLGTLKPISEIEDLYKTRAEMEADANDYIQMLSKYGQIYDDPYLESYLYSIVTRILPKHRADGFPYDLKIVLVRDETMNACIFPNGIMIINTGLLAELHTEDELVAVVSHELGHFVANHSLVNMRNMEKKAARAEFWAGLATIAAATVEGIASAASDQYYTGALTYGTAAISSAFVSDFLARVGANYSKEQEKEADQIALKVLKYLGYDTNAEATLFQRMTDAYNAEGNWAAYYMSGDHPSLKERIGYSGTPYKKTDPVFEKKISFAVTEAAISKYVRGRFTQALNLVSQNINNKVGTDDDYLIKALCTLNLYSDAGHNEEARSCIKMAKSLNPANENILRTEIISCLRSNDNREAGILLDDYLNKLNNQLDHIENKESYSYRALLGEQDWARKMAIKVKGL